MNTLTTTVYTAESRVKHPAVLIREMCRDLLAGRELAWRLFVRDLAAQYRQTYLGYLWAFLPPLVTSLTFIYLNSQGIVRIAQTGIPYPAFALIGTLLWQTFVDALQCPLRAINSNKAMLSKINLPREGLLMGGFYMVLFSFCIRIMLLAIVMAVWRITPGLRLFVFPFAATGLLTAGLAIGMLILPFGMIYGDITRSVNMLLPFWMLLTPVVYPSQPRGFSALLARWNPLSPLVSASREALCNQTLTSQITLICIIFISVLLVFLGLLIFRLVIPFVIERMGG